MKKKTFVAFVLDTSGSMSAIRESAIRMFNEQRDTVYRTRKDGGRTRASLVLFGTNRGDVEVVHSNKKVGNIPLLTEASYRPSGWTPMRDGIGRAITLLEGQDDGGKDTAFLVVVITDGLENHSTEWSAKILSEKVTKLQNTGRWTFALYGADNLDLAELKETGGLSTVPLGNLMRYEASPAGVHAMSAAMAGSTAKYMADRGTGLTAKADFVEDSEAEATGDKT